MDILRIELPYPPSINHYYVRTQHGVTLSIKGRGFRRDVSLLCHKHRGTFKRDMRLNVTINAFPPDNRVRDLDNICKATMDAMQHAGIYEDDSQIDMLTLIRRDVTKQGCLQIWISECS